MFKAYKEYGIWLIQYKLDVKFKHDLRFRLRTTFVLL